MKKRAARALHPVLVSQAGKLAVERGWAINVGECPAWGSWPVQGLGAGRTRRNLEEVAMSSETVVCRRDEPVPPSGMESLSKRVLQIAPQSCLCILPVVWSSLSPRKPVPSPGQLCMKLKPKDSINLLGSRAAFRGLAMSWWVGCPRSTSLYSQGP